MRDYEEIEKGNASVLIKKFKFRVSIEKNNSFSNDIIVSDDYMFDFINLNHTGSFIKIAIVHDNVNKWIESGHLKEYDFIFTVSKEYRKLLKEKYKNVFVVNGNSIYLQLKNILNILYMRRKVKFYHFINDRFNHVFPKWANYFKIVHSEFFDEEWYRNTYKIPVNTDPVFHYLVIGYRKNFNPGPDFDTRGYFAMNPDVERAEINPLLHYEMYGRKENRKISNFDHYCSIVSDSPYFDEEWYEQHYEFSDEYNDAATHFLKVGCENGCDPGPDFNVDDYYEVNPDVLRAGMNPLLHYEIYGRNENRRLHPDDK